MLPETEEKVLTEILRGEILPEHGLKDAPVRRCGSQVVSVGFETEIGTDEQEIGVLRFFEN